MAPLKEWANYRPPTTGSKSNTRPDAAITNRTLQKAALMALTLPKPEQAPCLSERSALKASQHLTKSLTTSQGSNSSRVAQPVYPALGEYRPPKPDCTKITPEGKEEFQAMLAMIGEKCRQKFSKAREVFRFIDSDHSGTISRGEVHYFFRFFNVAVPEADKFFDGFDKDDDGEIAYVEFVKYLWPHVNPGNEQLHWSLAKDVRDEIEADKTPFRYFVRDDNDDHLELPQSLKIARANIAQRLELKYKNSRDAFRDLDYSRDGKISLDEVQQFFKNFGWEEVAEKFFEVLDHRGHGEIDFDVFAKLFSRSSDADLRMRL